MLLNLLAIASFNASKSFSVHDANNSGTENGSQKPGSQGRCTGTAKKRMTGEQEIRETY